MLETEYGEVADTGSVKVHCTSKGGRAEAGEKASFLGKRPEK